MHGSHNDTEDFLDLFQQLGYRYRPGDKNWQIPEDWLLEDTNDPGYQLMTDAEIIQKFQVQLLQLVESTSEDDEAHGENKVQYPMHRLVMP